MDTLIIAEKPSVALRLAIAIGEGKAERKRGAGRSSYFEVSREGHKVYIAAAVGHIFTIKQSDNAKGYPVLNVEWAPSYTVSKRSFYTKDYLDTLSMLGKECGLFINACDFDLEGTVIGTNIIRYISKGMESTKTGRMKFSTTTTRDLINAYTNILPLDMSNFYAGETRHILDWLWGINLSRALMRAINEGSAGKKEVLSVGRVQGPTLAILAKRELEIGSFTPEPFWRVLAQVRGVGMLNERGDIKGKEIAETAAEETKRNSNGVIESAEEKEEELWPYPPFDLTSLQLEASRTMHIDPSITLAIAQTLYERSYISYPRTSSQKLPAILNLPQILSELAKNPEYSKEAEVLISEKRFRPREGPKYDEAHPAIFPTGVMPKGLSKQESMIYDLIARRFLACFAKPARVATSKVVARFGAERYSVSGKRVIERNWMDFYKYAKVDEKELPKFKSGEPAIAEKVEVKEMQTQPPKRYTKAGIIAELERKNLGTKATRAQIVDTLFRRGYIEGGSIKVTSLGMAVYKALKDNCEMIVDESTTRALEEDMEKIAKNEKSEEEVIDEGKRILLEALKLFDKNMPRIAEEMKSSKEAMPKQEVLGKCPVDGGDLIIRRSRKGKQFVGCSNYPKCTNTYPLPQRARVFATGKVCKVCGAPIVKILLGRGGAFETDLNLNCKEGKASAEAQEKHGAKGALESSNSAKARSTGEKAVLRQEAADTAAKAGEPKKEIKASTEAEHEVRKGKKAKSGKSPRKASKKGKARV
ncbi:MAG: DNA topoisomerase I [Candidatus Micrarchaeia archaeon]